MADDANYWGREELEQAIRDLLEVAGRPGASFIVFKRADLDEHGCDWHVEFRDKELKSAAIEQGLMDLKKAGCLR